MGTLPQNTEPYPNKLDITTEEPRTTTNNFQQKNSTSEILAIVFGVLIFIVLVVGLMIMSKYTHCFRNFKKKRDSVSSAAVVRPDPRTDSPKPKNAGPSSSITPKMSYNSILGGSMMPEKSIDNSAEDSHTSIIPPPAHYATPRPSVLIKSHVVSVPPESPNIT